MKQELKKELMPLVCAFGFLSIYAVENKKEKTHNIYKMIDEVRKVIKLYESKCKQLLNESFEIFDDITSSKNIEIDTIAISNALIVFHKQNKKYFNINQKKINEFWIKYKKEMKANNKENLELYANSRLLAKEFYKRLESECNKISKEN